MTDQYPRSGSKILVSDVPELRQIIRILLEREGYEIVESEPGDEASLREAAARGVDMIITNDPGPFLALSIPLVYISGAPDYDVLAACEAKGHALLRKPFTIRGLRDAVWAALGRSR